MHVHVAETPDEDAALRDEYGSVPAMLERLGVLGGRVLAAHGVQLSDDDIGLLADRGVAVAHCPGSNAKLAAGIARVAALRRAGVRVGLGTDGPASGDDLDMWAQDRLAGLLARVTSGDAAALTAAELLLMATRDGAAAIGRDDLGALEAGRLGRPGARRPRRPRVRRARGRRAAAVEPGVGRRGPPGARRLGGRRAGARRGRADPREPGGGDGGGACRRRPRPRLTAPPVGRQRSGAPHACA